MNPEIKAYLDGELAPEQAAAVERLLAEDPEARRQAESFRAISESIRALARQPEPAGLDRAVERAARPRPRPVWAWAAPAAAVVLLGVLGPRLLPLGALPGMPASQPYSAGAESGPDLGIAPAKEEANADAPTASAPGAGAGTYRARPEQGEAEAKTAVPPTASTARPQPSSVLDPNRRVIKNAELGLRVKDAKQALDEVQRHTSAIGGFVASSSLSQADGRPVAYATLRVPSARFDATLAMIRGLGTVDRETSSGEDVTAQVADLDARARTLAAEEQALIEMLRSARTLGNILAVREKLAQVRGEIESLKAQSLALKDLAALSTVSVELKQAEAPGEPAKPEDWLEATLASAVNLLAAIGRVVAQGLLYALVLSPVWLPAVLVARWAMRRGPRP